MRRTLMFPGLVVLLFLLVGLTAGGYVYKERSHSVRERFYVAAVTESRTLAAQLEQNLAQLNAMVSYFSASEHVREAEFTRFSDSVLSDSLQGQTIVWTSVVPVAELEDFVTRIRADNPEAHGDFSLNLRERPLESYEVPGLGAFVGTYSRPSKGRAYVGWVVDPEGEAASTMLRAINGGRPNISAIHLNAAEDPVLADKPCIVLTMPVFSGEGRSRTLKGLLSAIISVPELMGVDPDAPLNPDLSHRILDRDFGDGVVYDLDTNTILDDEAGREHRATGHGKQLVEPMGVVNRHWTLVVEPSEGAFTTPLLPSILAFAVFLLFGGGIAHTMWRQRVRLERTKSEATVTKRDMEALAKRATRLEGDLRQTAESRKSVQARYDEALARARYDRRMLESLLNRLPQGVCILDAEARLVAWNRHVAGLLDISDGTLKSGTEVADLLLRVDGVRAPDGGAPPADSWQTYFSRDASAAGEGRLELTMSSGIVLSALRAPGPNGSCMLILSGGGAGASAPVELRRKAHFDELTGLMARPRFEEVLAKAMRGRRSTDTGLALVLVDVDEMGVVNDAYGHDVGDEMLATVADILRRHIREADLAARLEGDTFALLLSAVDDVRMVMGRTEELLQAIWEPMEVRGNRLQVNANMGIAMYPNQAIDPESLTRLATDALDRAKADKRKNVIIADTVPHNVGTRPSTATKH